MSKKSIKKAIKDTLLSCPVCDSVEFCVTQEKVNSFIWVRCRQCDTAFASVQPINYKRMVQNVPN